MRPSVDDLGYAQTVWDYMFLRHDPVPSDIIIGLGSHDLTAADDVAELYARGMARIVVFSGNVGRLTEGRFDQSEAKMMQDRARLSGVPDSAMLLEEESTNTGENLRLTQRLLREAGVQARSVIIVHKPYMLRRDYATFHKQWEEAAKTSLICWASSISMREYLESASLDAHETISVMVGDLQRVRDYPKQGFQIEQDIPDDVWLAYEELVARGYDSHILK